MVPGLRSQDALAGALDWPCFTRRSGCAAGARRPARTRSGSRPTARSPAGGRNAARRGSGVGRDVQPPPLREHPAPRRARPAPARPWPLASGRTASSATKLPSRNGLRTTAIPTGAPPRRPARAPHVPAAPTAPASGPARARRSPGPATAPSRRSSGPGGPRRAGSAAIRGTRGPPQRTTRQPAPAAEPDAVDARPDRRRRQRWRARSGRAVASWATGVGGPGAMRRREGPAPDPRARSPCTIAGSAAAVFAPRPLM